MAKKKTKRSKRPEDQEMFHPTPENPSMVFEDLVESLEIEDWDIVIIGDGSGSNWKYGCGWASVSVERDTFKQRFWCGCLNYGTVNIAEMMAYLQPLNAFAAIEDQRRKEKKSPRFRQVHIITDSEYCQIQGESGNLSPRKNGAFWRMFEDFQRRGLVLNWHWVERDKIDLNRYVDAASKAARLLMKENDVRSIVETNASGETLHTLEEFNPIVVIGNED